MLTDRKIDRVISGSHLAEADFLLLAQRLSHFATFLAEECLSPELLITDFTDFGLLAIIKHTIQIQNSDWMNTVL